jgi:CheY-like chemotaxis protein
MDFSDKHVLLVDDEPLVTRSLKKLLIQAGISNVWIAENGDKALQMVKELRDTKSRSFDLIISDIRMPGIDGIETIKRAKDFISNAHGKESPVIFITGYEGDANFERAKQIGYVDYLYKPLDIKHFLTSVKKQLQCSNV